MQGFNLLYISLILALSVYFAECQRECKPRRVATRLDRSCRQRTGWETEKDNEKSKTVCRCLLRGLKQCRTCEYQDATTTEGPSETTANSEIPETTFNPEIPVTTENPEIPETTFNPELPETTFNPELPDTTANTELPVTTLNPETPESGTVPSEFSTSVQPPEIQ